MNVLVIWASWCKGCPERLRRIASLEGVGSIELSSVAYQDDPKAAQQVLESTGATWSRVLDDGPILPRLGTEQLPETYVLNQLNRHREVACVSVGRTDVAQVRAAVERLRRSPGRLGPC